MNKIPLNQISRDSNTKYLQIIREKEECNEALQTINQQLRRDIEELRLQNTQGSQAENVKFQKLEDQIFLLKQMLSETQQFVLQYQNDLNHYQQIAQMIVTSTEIYKFNQKVTLEQILQFLSQEVYSQEIINVWMIVKPILKDALNNVEKQKINNSILKEAFQTFFRNYTLQFHPLSTRTMIEEIILMLNEQCTEKVELQVQNYSDQFKQQIEKINLFESSIVIINQEEDQLRRQLKSTQIEVQQLTENLVKQELQMKEMQEYQCHQIMKNSERKPFVDILSVKDVASSFSEDANAEIMSLQQQLDEKDILISKLQQNIKVCELQQERQIITKSPWDLIINCVDNSLSQLHQKEWTLTFKNNYGISAYQILCSFYGLKSEYLQFVLENSFPNDFTFSKLADQTYIQLENEQLIYLKSILNNDMNLLVQTKILTQLSGNFYSTNNYIEGQEALTEFWIQFSLEKGIFFLCINELNQENQKLLQLTLNIQEKITSSSILIVVFDEDKLAIDTIDLYCEKHQFILYGDEPNKNDQVFQRIIMMSNQRFDLDKIIQSNKQSFLIIQNYVNNLNSFLMTNLSNYFVKQENTKLEFKQSLMSDFVFEMKLNQLSNTSSIKLKQDRATRIIQEDQIQLQKISESSYDVIFPEKLQQVRLKSYVLEKQGVIVLLKCTFDDDNLTIKQFALKSAYQKNNESEVSFTIIDNKVAIQI